MFQVKLLKQVHNGFSAAGPGDVWLYRVVSLPFVPVPGMYFEDRKAKFYEQAVEVNYGLGDGLVEVYTAEDKELYHAALNGDPGRPIQEIVAEYLAIGWEADTPEQRRGR